MAKFTIFVDPNYSYEKRMEIGEAAVERIRERTKQGIGASGKQWGRYSSEYQRHIDFQIAGKDPAPVNLTLTGDMLDSVQVLDASIPGIIEIGIEEGVDADKAKWVAEKGYDFLGISDTEVGEITSQVGEPTFVDRIDDNLSSDIAQRLLRGIFGG